MSGDLAVRLVALTELPDSSRVSTVLLPPWEGRVPEWDLVRYETLIRGGPHHNEGEQYATLEEARAGHELWVLVAEGTLTPEAIHEMREVTAS